MMDTKQWNKFAGEHAEYAIGGAPLEMYCESYKQTHSSSNISCNVIGKNGYSFSNEKGLSSDCDGIYIKVNDYGVYGTWLSSPSNHSPDELVIAMNSGRLDYGCFDTYNYGLRPLVCLESEVQLKKTGDRVYTIQQNVD